MEKYRTKRRFDSSFLPLKQSDGESNGESNGELCGQLSVELASAGWRSSPSRLKPSTLPYLLLWLRSGKNLDLCLLALCSCILSLLCHQTVSSLPSSSTLTSSSAPISSPTAGLSRIDLVIKAGLFTTSSQNEEEAKQSE